MAEPPIRVYLRDGCHLCDEALAAIGRLTDPSRVELVDIEADPALHAAYLERIPVVEVGGTVVCELICDDQTLADAL